MLIVLEEYHSLPGIACNLIPYIAFTDIYWGPESVIRPHRGTLPGSSQYAFKKACFLPVALLSYLYLAPLTSEILRR